jgi:peroxiredoxin Q/BCP
MPAHPTPALELPSTDGTIFRLEAARGAPLVVYFYPRDHTPGCTDQAAQFRDRYAAFRDLGIAIYGVSRDSIRSHRSFKDKLGLPFELLSDPDETACQAWGVMKSKKLYGKPVRGIERSTFVIDASGAIAREWRGVKVPGHADEVLAYATTLA